MAVAAPETAAPPAPTNGREAALPHTVIVPPSGWRMVNWGELVAYRDLVVQFVLRDVSAKYKQTVLGYAWAVIRPFVSMVIFSVVFGGLASIPSDGVPYPLFSFAALLPWTYFSGSLTASVGSLLAQRNVFTKVYFPRLIIPTVPAITALIDFAIASVMLAGIMAFYGVAPSWNAVFLPALILIMMATAIGTGLWLSSLALQYRDVNQAMSFMTQLLMYAAPVVWPVSLLAEKFPETADTIRLVYGLYPMAGVIEGFRAALLGTTAMPWDLIGMGALSATVLLTTGALYFRRSEPIFADVA